MKEIIDNILQKYINLLNSDEVISIFVVGSMAEADYQEKTLNDYDIRFVVKKMNYDIYNKIMLMLNLIKDDIRKHNISCVLSDVIGPVKMETTSDRNVLLHAIIMTQTELDQLPNIHKYSYSQQYQILFGQDLISEYKKIILTPNDVISSIEGIEFCIYLIKNKVVSYDRWVVKENEFILEREWKPASSLDMLELFIYSFKKTYNNILNMIITNHISKELDDYLKFSKDEITLINKIKFNQLDIHDVENTTLIIKILYQLEKICLQIYNKSKEYYNSLEWGIIKDNSASNRKQGFEFLKKIQLPMGDNFSIEVSEYDHYYDELNARIEKSHYLVIFEPPSNQFDRYGIYNINSGEQITEFIKEKGELIKDYNISFVEIIDQTEKSYVGTVMSDGKGNVIIETLNGTCDSRELTSRGADSSKIRQYIFNSFYHYNDVPRDILDIKEICQYFKGYYEFAYGSIRGEEKIYFTFYSSDEAYTNIFEGGMKNAKTLRNRRGC